MPAARTAPIGEVVTIVARCVCGGEALSRPMVVIAAGDDASALHPDMKNEPYVVLLADGGVPLHAYRYEVRAASGQPS